MKKIISFAILLWIIISTQHIFAQQQQFQWIATFGTGAAISPIEQDPNSFILIDEEANIDNIPGFSFQFGAGFRFTPIEFLSLETSLLYNHVKSKRRQASVLFFGPGTQGLHTTETDFKRIYISMPIQVKLNFNKLSLGFGYQFSKVGQTKQVVSNIFGTEMFDPLTGETFEPITSDVVADSEIHTAFDHGLIGSLDVPINKSFELFVSYYHGLKNTFINQNTFFLFQKKHQQLMIGGKYILPSI